MDPATRIVTQLPLTELWRRDGFTSKLRIRSLSAGDIASLLRGGRVQFVVVEVGQQPHWIALEDRYDFWKTEVRSHLATSDSPAYLREFADSYCYRAYEWTSSEERIPLVVLERNH